MVDYRTCLLIVVIVMTILTFLGVKFPERAPILTLRSVYHCNKGKPKFKVLPACPYKNFEGYIEQQVELFKNECKGIVGVNNQHVNIDN